MAIGTAFRAFFAALFDSQKSALIEQALDGTPATPAITPPLVDGPAAVKPAVPAKPVSRRSDAISLLAALQREARLVDLIQENLSAYSDAQIGAAARPCLTQCASVLDRMLGLQPIVSAAEGESIDVPADAHPSRYLWIGEGSGSSGKLVHHGWQATRVELPKWTGETADEPVVAPVQVQRV